MPKPILKRLNKIKNESFCLTSISWSDQVSVLEVQRLLRKKRSEGYMKILSELDAGNGDCDPNKVREIINVIRNEFSEISINSIFLGIIAKCYLGDTYEVHTLSFDGEIIQHFKRGESLPPFLEKARGIAYQGNYEFIEVYVDCCRVINSFGEVATIKL